MTKNTQNTVLKGKVSRKINVVLKPTKKQEKQLIDLQIQAKKLWNITLAHHEHALKKREELKAQGVPEKELPGVLGNKGKDLNKEVYGFLQKGDPFLEHLVNSFGPWERLKEVGVASPVKLFEDHFRQHGRAVIGSVARNDIVRQGTGILTTWANYFDPKQKRFGRKPPKYKGRKDNAPKILVVPNKNGFRVHGKNKRKKIKIPSVDERVVFLATNRFEKWLYYHSKKAGEPGFGEGTVSYKDGKWILSLTFSIPKSRPVLIQQLFGRSYAQPPQKSVGVDAGATIPFVCSDGDVVGQNKNLSNVCSGRNTHVSKEPYNKDDWRKLQEQSKRLQKRLSKYELRRWNESQESLGLGHLTFVNLSTKQIGEIKRNKRKRSRKELKILARKQKVDQKLNRKKMEYKHQLSNYLAQKAETVYVEDLQLKNMTKSSKGTSEKPGKNVRAKAALNKSVLENNISGVVSMLEYKIQDYGGRLVHVPAHYTSLTCPSCGYCSTRKSPKDKRNRKSQARFECAECGYADNADLVGADNILAKGMDPKKWEEKRWTA